LKEEAFLNGLLTQCTLLPLPYFLALLFPQDRKQCLYLLFILILEHGYIISVQRKKILKLYMETIHKDPEYPCSDLESQIISRVDKIK